MNAQNEIDEKIPLSEVLSFLEKEYKVSFSYADEFIVNKFVRVPENSLSITEVIQELEKKTDLKFTIINDRFIAIKRTTNSSLAFEELGEVVIQGYLADGITKKTDGSISIKTNKLGVLPGLIEPDVLQTVKALPGVVSVDESISNLNIRGGTTDQNLILFDGVRMYMSGHFFGLISAFNPYLEQEVILSKSGSNAKYGEGVSSVIDIKLPNKINDNDLKFSSSLNLLNVNLTSSIPITKNAELQLGMRRSMTDFVNTPTYSKYFDRAFQDSDLEGIRNNESVISKEESFRFYDIYGKLIWDLTGKDKLSLVVLNIDNGLDYEESLINATRDQDFISELSQKNITSGLTYEKKWSEKLETIWHAYYTNYQLFSNNADILNAQNLIQENRVEDNGFKLAADYTINKKASLHSGYQFSQMAVGNLEDVDNPFFRRYIKHVMRTHSLYSSFNYNTEKISLKAGIRSNYFEKLDKITVEPRLALNYKLTNNFGLEITGDIKSQAISQIIDLQNDFLGIEKRRWMLANGEDIPLITSQQIASGLYYTNKGFLISAEVYLKYVDGINSRSQGFQNQFQYVKDIGSYNVKGIDFLIQKKLHNLKLWMSYSYLENNYLFENLNDTELFPNNVDIRNIINFSSTYSNKKIEFGLGLNWHSGNPFTQIIGLNDIATNIEFDDPNASRITEFLRLDSSLGYRFNLGKAKAKAGVSVWNVLNNENVLNTYFEIQNSSISQIENTSLGITPNASFKVDF